MSFSMTDIKRKSTSKKEKIVECKRYVRLNEILTDNVKVALTQYVNYRFNKRIGSNFTPKRLKEMTEELLSYVLHKDISEITIEDININENRIINEIYRAVFYGATKHLYYEKGDIVNIDSIKLRDNLKEPTKIPQNKQLQKEEILNYFKGLII